MSTDPIDKLVDDHITEALTRKEQAEQQAYRDAVEGAELVPTSIRTTVYFTLATPVDFETDRQGRCRLFEIAATSDRYINPTDPDDQEPYVEVKGLAHRLTGKGELSKSERASWQYMPTHLAAYLFGKAFT